MNRSNNDGQPWTGSAEGKPLNLTFSTQRQIRVPQALAGVRRAATDRKGNEIHALLHHVTVGLPGTGNQLKQTALARRER
jgi:hypothetical protein